MWRQNRIYKGRNGGVYPVRNHVISFENVVKQFDDEPVLKNVSFEIEEGKFYTLLGPFRMWQNNDFAYYCGIQ